MARADEVGLSDSITSQAAVLSELVAAYLEGTLKRSGLTFGAFELLSAVRASPSGNQAELAERLGITPSSLCEAVRAAVGKGLVEQEISSTDRRAKRIVLTRKGAKVLAEAIQTLQQAEAAAGEGIAGNRLAVAIDTLRAASKNLTKAIASS